MDARRALYRSTSNRQPAGGCGGLAEYFTLDPTLIRVHRAWLMTTSAGGSRYAAR